MPDGTWLPFDPAILPEHVTFITLSPSGVSSLHDRVCQCFYEMVGGTVQYGDAHSAFHGHSSRGPTFATGRHPVWGPDNPVHLVGHSFGGVTVRVLHAYLARGSMFPGYTTSADWVVSVTSMNGPLNGCLNVYGLGANLSLPPCVRWASGGCVLGWLAHVFEYLDAPTMRAIYDFKLAQWGLAHQRVGAAAAAALALFGVCVHTTTDNAAYDMTVHAQVRLCDPSGKPPPPRLSRHANPFLRYALGTMGGPLAHTPRHILPVHRRHLLRHGTPRGGMGVPSPSRRPAAPADRRRRRRRV